MSLTCTEFTKPIISRPPKVSTYVDYGPPDYIKILDWAEEVYGSDFKPAIRLHSANPVGVANMRRIIERNGWKEIR